MSSRLYIVNYPPIKYSNENLDEGGMIMKKFLVLFYAVQLVMPDLVVTLEDQKIEPAQERHFLPLIKDFLSIEAAQKWAEENLDLFFEVDKKWLVKFIRVYWMAEISGPAYESAIMIPSAKQLIEERLQGIVFAFMDEEFVEKFATVLMHTQSKQSFNSDEERWMSSANFMLQPAKKSCEKEPGYYATFFAGDFNTKIQSALVKYFKKREGAKELAQTV